MTNARPRLFYGDPLPNLRPLEHFLAQVRHGHVDDANFGMWALSHLPLVSRAAELAFAEAIRPFMARAADDGVYWPYVVEDAQDALKKFRKTGDAWALTSSLARSFLDTVPDHPGSGRSERAQYLLQAAQEAEKFGSPEQLAADLRAVLIGVGATWQEADQMVAAIDTHSTLETMIQEKFQSLVVFAIDNAPDREDWRKLRARVAKISAPHQKNLGSIEAYAANLRKRPYGSSQRTSGGELGDMLDGRPLGTLWRTLGIKDPPAWFDLDRALRLIFPEKP